MNLVKSIKSLLKKIILKSFSHSRIFRNITGIGYFGLNGIDKEIRKYLAVVPGFYVELGANDGIKQSNTLTLEKYEGWHGILIEPEPNNFKNLLKNRSGRNFFSNCACVRSDYALTEMEMIYSDLMTIQTGGSLDIDDPEGHAQTGLQFISNDSSYKFKSPARTLTSLLSEVGAPNRMQLLSLDVEGAELDVLNGLDHSKYRFDIICVECRNLEPLGSHLESAGYSLLKQISHHDYLFKDATENSSE